MEEGPTPFSPRQIKYKPRQLKGFQVLVLSKKYGFDFTEEGIFRTTPSAGLLESFIKGLSDIFQREAEEDWKTELKRLLDNEVWKSSLNSSFFARAFLQSFKDAQLFSSAEHSDNRKLQCIYHVFLSACKDNFAGESVLAPTEDAALATHLKNLIGELVSHGFLEHAQVIHNYFYVARKTLDNNSKLAGIIDSVATLFAPCFGRGFELEGKLTPEGADVDLLLEARNIKRLAVAAIKDDIFKHRFSEKKYSDIRQGRSEVREAQSELDGMASMEMLPAFSTTSKMGRRGRSSSHKELERTRERNPDAGKKSGLSRSRSAKAGMKVK